MIDVAEQQTTEQELPEGWKWVRLADHSLKIGSGVTPRGGYEAYVSSGIPFIRSQNVHHRKFVRKGLTFITPEQDADMQGSRVQPQDVLLNITGASIGRVCVVPNDICPANVNQHVSIIRLDNTIDPTFLAFYISNPEFQEYILRLEAGATRQALTKSLIENFRIPLPSLSEQQRIVLSVTEQLVEVEKAHAAAEAQRNAAQDLRSVYLRHIFTGDESVTWPQIYLKDIARLERGKFTPRPRNDPRYFGGPYPWIQIGEVEQSQKYVKTHRTTLNDLGLSVSKKFDKGTLVISIAATIGAVGILDFDACMPDSLVAVIPIAQKSHTDFLYYLFLFIRDHLQTIAPQMAQANLKLELLNPLRLRVPSYDRQQELAFLLDRQFELVQHLEQSVQNQLNIINDLPAALLRQAFSGAL